MTVQAILQPNTAVVLGEEENCYANCETLEVLACRYRRARIYKKHMFLRWRMGVNTGVLVLTLL